MIEYKIGDAVNPKRSENQQIIIAHIVNDKGGWGAGFSGALSERFPMVEKLYRDWNAKGELALHKNQYIAAAPGIIVVNMCAQHHWKPHVEHPLDYAALDDCLWDLAVFAGRLHPRVQVVMPRIGAGLAGGDWSKIEKMINSNFTKEVPITVYDLP